MAGYCNAIDLPGLVIDLIEMDSAADKNHLEILDDQLVL